MTTRALLLGAAAFAFAAPAFADHHGWYLGLEGGGSWVDDVDAVAHTFGEPPTSGTISFDSGWALFGTVGYAFGNHWRIEGEGSFRRNDTTSNVADLEEWSLMINALYDIDIGERTMVSLGAGVGYDNANFGAGPVEDDDGNIAIQGIAGLSYAISPGIDLTMTYRYLRVSEPEFELGGGAVQLNLDDVSKHAVTVGLRFDLSPAAAPPAPPPPSPPPPPPPPITEPFVIFFGFGKCNITPEADAVLSEAANAVKRDGSAKVRIVGHTDSVGSPAANQRLSECRANAAKANLVGKGVAEGTIATSGKGESEPMVQTGDGVKEPQNRRVTIDLE